ncbi:MAG: hypothetical protein RIC55_17325 [Pirellulaceae bacterium]
MVLTGDQLVRFGEGFVMEEGEYEQSRERRKQDAERLRKIVERDLQVNTRQFSGHFSWCPTKFSKMFSETLIVEVCAVDGVFRNTSLPSGSYTICALRPTPLGVRAIELTTENGEVNKLLAANWLVLPNQSPVLLAEFVLTFFGDDVRINHKVLADVDDLWAMKNHRHRYVIDEEAVTKVESLIGRTELHECEQAITLRCLTLLGWMHEKQDLGIETITIERDGSVTRAERVQLCSRTFLETPDLWY